MKDCIFSAIFEFDKKSLEIILTDYYKTIINSKHSFTYEDAHNIINDEKSKSPIDRSLSLLIRVS